MKIIQIKVDELPKGYEQYKYSPPSPMMVQLQRRTGERSTKRYSMGEPLFLYVGDLVYFEEAIPAEIKRAVDARYFTATVLNEGSGEQKAGDGNKSSGTVEVK